MLVGREAECARLDSQAGRSGVLVISLYRQIGTAVVASNPAGRYFYSTLELCYTERFEVFAQV
jgi:hypothetical protein